MYLQTDVPAGAIFAAAQPTSLAVHDELSPDYYGEPSAGQPSSTGNVSGIYPPNSAVKESFPSETVAAVPVLSTEQTVQYIPGNAWPALLPAEISVNYIQNIVQEGLSTY